MDKVCTDACLPKEEWPAPSKECGKLFFLGWFGALFLLDLLALAGVYIAQYARSFDILIASIVAVLFILITRVIFSLKLWYRAWDAIQDGHARMTPGKAVGYSFIPLFNLYWGYQLSWGFTRDFNQLVIRHGFRIPKLSEEFALLMTTMTIFGIGILRIPTVGPIYGVIVGILWLAFAEMLCDGLERLYSARRSTSIRGGTGALGTEQLQALYARRTTPALLAILKQKTASKNALPILLRELELRGVVQEQIVMPVGTNCPATHSDEDRSSRPAAYINLHCDGCERRYRAPSVYAGRHMRCKSCGKIIVIPPQLETPKS